MPHTLAIDFGVRNIGLALVEHHAEQGVTNRVRYAATVVVDAIWLGKAVKGRPEARRIRRTRKTHRRRMERLAQALHGMPGDEHIVRFCRRRGYAYDPPEELDDAAESFHIPRERFFAALAEEIKRCVPAEHRHAMLAACRRHLNASRRREAELRPARFENRNRVKCRWAGCSRNVPRAGNDYRGRLQQALYVWLKPIFDRSEQPATLRRSVDHWIAELDGLARWRAAAEQLDDDARKEQTRRRTRVYRNLLARIDREMPDDVAERFREAWATTYRGNLNDIVTGKQGGRCTYCRKHSDQFVDDFLAGRPIPHGEEVTERDLISRKQQLIFSRLWRLIEARLLPLAGGRIDRVVVERVAFDVLAGRRKNRQKLGEESAAEMYWYGPQYGFPSRLDMLKAEFDGKCAYCDNPLAEEVEHLLPQSEFPLNSYFNVLPACRECNRKKGARPASAARLTVTPEAVAAYSKYIAGLRVPHLFHTIKKGMLTLLSRGGDLAVAERQLGLIANNLVTITNTQRGPRPLARYLATKLGRATGHRPEVGFTAGRHTALYREMLLPDYDKPAARDEGDLVNHAVDAIVLGCRLPAATVLEGQKWFQTPGGIRTWRSDVSRAGPELAGDVPRVEGPEPIAYFEDDLGAGYFRIDMSAFNWNQKRKSGHRMDPIGMTRAGRPIDREPTAEVLKHLQKAASRPGMITRIAHPALRKALEAAPDRAAETFIAWLQQTTEAGLNANAMGRHPADQQRQAVLRQFTSTPVEHFLGDDATADVPGIVGVRCLKNTSASVFDVPRSDAAGRVFQHYKGDPRISRIYVGYRHRNGQLDRSRPVVYCVNQVHAVWQRTVGRDIDLDHPPGSPLRGRPLGSTEEPEKAFLAHWHAALDRLCAQAGIVKRFVLYQGCVLEKADGTHFQLRNFDKSQPWINANTFRHIRRVYRSPLRFAAEDGAGRDV